MMPSLFFDPHALLPRGQSSGPANDVAATIRAIRSDPKHAYNVPTHAEHQSAVKQMADLYGWLFPDQDGEPELCQ